MISSMKLMFLILTTFLFVPEVSGGSYHEIKVSIDGYQDSTLLLTSYFGDKIKLVDTAYVDRLGNFLFKGEQKLPGGIYMIVSADKKKLFEFIIGENQKFSLQTDTIDFALSMKVKGSKQNKIFYQYLKFNEKQYSLNKALLKKLDSVKSGSQESDKLRASIDSVNKLLVDYKLKVIDENPDTFIATLYNAMREIEIPDSVKNSTDSTLTFKYYKQHYWDYFDLSDSSLLRTPIFNKKLKQYFDQLVVFHPDSVIEAIDIVVSKSRPSQEVVGYLVWYFISEYQNPKFMGFDKVFVHLVDSYFGKEQITGTTPSILKSLQERAAKIKPILLDMPAPDLFLIDTSGAFLSFRSIPNEYTILFFWDTDCGVCGKEIIDLNKLYKQPEYDIEVYAINVNSDLEKWKKAIVEKKVPGISVNGTRSATKDFHDLYDIYGTPVIYVLDKDKKIIAKRIGAAKVADAIDNYNKYNEETK